MPGPRTILLLECTLAEKWAGLTEACWRAVLERPGDSWQVFCLPAGVFPSVEQVRAAACIIIGGSPHSANEDTPWVRQLVDVLPAYVATGTRHIGACFGCQVLAAALGGRVGTNPSGRFVLGMESIKWDQEALEGCGLQAALHAPPAGPLQPGAAAPPAMQLLESHGECVAALPPSAVRLATSGTAAVEAWHLGSNVLGIQFHPELPPALAREKIWAALSASGRLDAQEAAASDASLRAGAPDTAAVVAVLHHFMDHGLCGGAGPAQGQGQEGRQEGQGAAGPAGPSGRAGPAASMAAAAPSGRAGAPAAVQASGSAGQCPNSADLPPGAHATAAHVAGLVEHTRQAFRAGLEHSLLAYDDLERALDTAGQQYGAMADASEALAERLRTSGLRERAPLPAALAAALTRLDAQLDQLAVVVGGMEQEAQALAREAGVAEGGTTGLAAWLPTSAAALAWATGGAQK